MEKYYFIPLYSQNVEVAQYRVLETLWFNISIPYDLVIQGSKANFYKYATIENYRKVYSSMFTITKTRK